MSDLDRKILNEVESGERWLAAAQTPGPSAESLARVKQAIRAELAHTQRPAARRWSSGYGVIAAAASIALAVYVAWSAVRSTPGPVPSIPQVAQKEHESGLPQSAAPVTADIASPNTDGDTEPTLVMSTQFDEKLSNLEEWSKDSTWDLSGSSLSAALDEIYREPSAKSSGRSGKASNG